MGIIKTEGERITLVKLRERFGDGIIDTHSFRNDDTAIVKKDLIVDICTYLKKDRLMQYNFLMDLTAVDYSNRNPRFEIVYHLYSLEINQRVRIKVLISEDDCKINTVITVWKGANWFEREVYDMYGIVFIGHPNLKRILLYEGFEGYPLRKDYPKTKRQPQIGPIN